MARDPEKRREYHLANKDRLNQNSRDWYANNKEKRREYLNTTLDRRRETGRKYYLENKDKMREYYNGWERRNKKINPNYKLGRLLRDRMRTALNKQWKSGSAVSDLGCSIEEFKLYIENQF